MQMRNSDNFIIQAIIDLFIEQALQAPNHH